MYVFPASKVAVAEVLSAAVFVHEPKSIVRLAVNAVVKSVNPPSSNTILLAILTSEMVRLALDNFVSSVAVTSTALEFEDVMSKNVSLEMVVKFICVLDDCEFK